MSGMYIDNTIGLVGKWGLGENDLQQAGVVLMTGELGFVVVFDDDLMLVELDNATELSM